MDEPPAPRRWAAGPAPPLSSGWPTSYELEFLRKLGSHSAHRLDPLTLLKRYRDTMHRRDNWGTMQVKTIRTYVVEQIARLERQKGPR